MLGSIPGVASLRAGQYYAHPRNHFWPIVEVLFGIARDLPYPLRCHALIDRGIAVWDVLQTCVRPGSLDAAIEPESIVANDFAGFLADYPGIRAIYCNGGMAATSYRRHVLPTLRGPAAEIPLVRLPSTSPANASYSFERKLAAWQVVCATL